MNINESLVNTLICEQFPQWASLSIAPVALSGWDNRTFHLGKNMIVRLPSAERYASQVKKEQQWLPRLAPFLPLPIPTPLAKGVPNHNYPWQWSIYRWIEGENATLEHIADLSEFAIALAQFLEALQRMKSADGPPPGSHNFFRGAPLAVYDTETRNALAALNGHIDTDTAIMVWETACQTIWQDSPVWFHGDIAAGNLLVNNGHLNAVIDFGCSGVGDPACDMAIAWTLFSGDSREAFRSTLPLDDATWERGRGWALWKSLITLAEYRQSHSPKAGEARRVIDEILADP